MGLGPENNPEVHLLGAFKWRWSTWSGFLQPLAGSLKVKGEIITVEMINKDFFLLFDGHNLMCSLKCAKLLRQISSLSLNMDEVLKWAVL